MGLFWGKSKEEKHRIKESKILAKQKKVLSGIAFGGGGTRGFAHLGAIKAFEENGIDFDFVSGTSIGSIVGAMYASGMTFKDMYNFGKDFKTDDVRNSKILFIPSKSGNIEMLMRSVIGDIVFSDLKKPLAIAAVDLISGEEVTLDSGLVARACSASSAVPGIFTPVPWQDYNLIDGGTTNPIPTNLARNLGAEVVVSIDINKTRGEGTTSTSAAGVALAALRIAMKANADRGIASADICIQPYLKDYKPTKTVGFEEMIREGYEETLKYIEPIKELLKSPTK